MNKSDKLLMVAIKTLSSNSMNITDRKILENCSKKELINIIIKDTVAAKNTYQYIFEELNNGKPNKI